MRDQFSSLTTATLVPSEQAEDLKNAIILLTTPIRMATNITIRVDRPQLSKHWLKTKI